MTAVLGSEEEEEVENGLLMPVSMIGLKDWCRRSVRTANKAEACVVA